MHNMVYLIGRLTSNIEIEEQDGRTKATIKVGVQRNFEKEEGVYETDIIPCMLWNGIATNFSEYCQKGDLVGLKGRIECHDGEIVVVVDKISFLSSKSNEEGEANE